MGAVGTAGLLLAAGEGRRYGMPKALAERGGRRWVDLALDVLRAGGCDPLVVVLGAAVGEVRHVATLRDAHVVENPGWAEGIGSSLRTGLAALAGTAASAAVVLLVDTPGITPAAVRRIAAAATDSVLAVATYAGRDGHPVLLGRAHWDGVAALAEGDTGARAYLRAHAADVRRIPCDDIADGTDIDTR
jgi:CTP:molybdopterin cytidylyltransferase MocA